MVDLTELVITGPEDVLIVSHANLRFEVLYSQEIISNA